ncbi:hypothetical protein [Mucilaginibacter polytrichastri]|uniref:Uncharacterized protein n=1 Tax=Mucilaginibacter polytrichastri TaxID=1302689 RepID=A0A1Q6A2D6_9SPHI|nr:hypothetical protein [Mucilaginibacter polytrichastri]OKS88184.1 hypothetical protein RG47T_3648 [Mucilaginibacter polytrichastri]SFT08754.1 hypothetical protein SAMN04487890_11056 [Mucilaginibacter polytrichastri]
MKRTKKLSYKTEFGRDNVIKRFLLKIFLGLSSLPRLLLEVFIRRSFGERYFSFSTSVILAILVGGVPYMYATVNPFYEHPSFLSYVWHHLSWYAFVLLFLYFAWRRWQEVKREPGIFDCAKYTLYTGNINRRFWELELFDVETTSRIISIYYEPAFFLIIGLVLALLGQNIGFLIIICSIIYSLGYAGAYYLGDQYIMDMLDQLIANEEMADSFIDDRGPENSRGYEQFFHKPANKEFRRRVAHMFYDDEHIPDVN